MPTLELEFEVYCSCGEGLCRQTNEGRTGGRDMPFITVQPCEKCITKAHQEGYDQGHDKGYEDGFEDGKREYRR